MVNSLLLLVYLVIPPTHGSLCAAEDPDFDEYRYEEAIPHCMRNVSTERKIEICLRDGIKDRTEFTVDHIIPLAFGGSNRDDNLWCQHKSLAVTGLEYQLYKKLDAGEIKQHEAIDMILDAKLGRH